MRLSAALAAAALAALSLLVVAPAPSYDPWAWLLWGRELTTLELSTAEGPAFKPLPVAICAVLAPLGSAAPVLWVLAARIGAALAVVLAYGLAREWVAGAGRTGGALVPGAGRSADAAAGPRGAWRVVETRSAGAAGTGGARPARVPSVGDARLVPEAGGWGARLAGVLAAAGVLLTGGYLGYAATGSSEGLLLALALGAVALARRGRPSAALACALGCALLRVEAWPFVAAYGAWLGWRGVVDRRLLAAAAVGVPALWLVPELLGSGDVLRSGSRARVPNPGQPALADVPAWASLRAAAELALWPLWIGVGALLVGARWRARTIDPALALAAVGAAWVAIVAAMAQAGFSGEPRYALPGVALLGIAGAVGLARLLAPAPLGAAAPEPTRFAARAPLDATVRAAALAVLLVALVLAAAPRLDALDGIRDGQRYQARLAADLREAIAATGGRRAVLACGRPYVGPLRGPLLAYALDVPKRTVGFEPRPPGAVFASRRTAHAPIEPAATGFRPVAANRSWTVSIRCP